MKKTEIIIILRRGGIGVMPTDTIYGLVGQALKPETVKRIYKVRRRSPDKPLIVLISSVSELKKFGVKLTANDEKFLNKYWPGELSVIMPCLNLKYKYLHRGTKTLAFRLPKKKSVLEILKMTGPLVAPSANPEGLPPAKDLKEAEEYFDEKVDFYFGHGELSAPASTLIRLSDGQAEVLRQGKVKIK